MHPRHRLLEMHEMGVNTNRDVTSLIILNEKDTLDLPLNLDYFVERDS